MTGRKRKPDLSEVPVTVADLRDHYEGRVFLVCPTCFAEYSAHKGDYWNLPAEHVFTCEHGGDDTYPEANCRLVRRETRLVDVRP